MKKSFTSKIGKLDKLKLYHVTIPKSILEIFHEDEKSIYNQRFLISVNGIVNWQGGSMSLGNNDAYITLSKDRMKILNVDFGDTINIELEKDYSEFGMEIPLEFEELLLQDEIGNQLFRNLTLGTQRAVIYLILQIKSSDKRIEKSIFFLENIKKANSKKINIKFTA